MSAGRRLVALTSHKRSHRVCAYAVKQATLMRTMTIRNVPPELSAALSAEKKQAYQARLFGEVLQHYLECVVQGVKFFATTGKTVRKDQFGKNSLYSA